MRLSIGSSAASDLATAAREAVRAAVRTSKAPSFALVLCTNRHDSSALAAAMNSELGGVPWAGCHTAGLLVGTTVVMDGLAVAVFEGDDTRVAVGLGGPVSVDPRGAGRKPVAEATVALGPLKPGSHRSLILLPDVLTGNAAEVIRGAAHEAGAGLTWAGGGSGDNARAIQSAHFARGTVHCDHLLVIGMDTDAPAATGIEHGWRPYGRPAQVTEASGATVVELDFEPAFDVYQRTAAVHGDVVSRESFPNFATRHPLGIPQASGRYVIRDPLFVEPSGGLRCVAEVPEGCLVQVMEGHGADLLDAAGRAAASARQTVAGPVAGALVFDCVSRSRILGARLADELLAIQAGLGADVPFIGCLTLGEVGVPGSGVPQFHNKTTVILALPGTP